jgi:hypothetical protein
VAVMNSLQDHIEPLLREYGVQLAFAGHVHNVERQSAVYQNEVVQKATMVMNANSDLVATHVDAEATVWMVFGTAGMLSSAFQYAMRYVVLYHALFFIRSAVGGACAVV